MPASTEQRVVALVPCKDGQASIAETVQALLQEPAVDEVVVIDDGSADDTTVKAAEAGARIIRLPDNAGKGAALKAGVDATPDATVYLLVDADTRTTAAETVHLLPQVLRGEADLVIGVLPSAGGRGGFGLVRDLAAKGIHRATGFQVTAPLSGQRAIRAELMRSLELAPRFGVEVGMTIDVINAGAKVTEREVAMEHKHHGKTFGGFLHRGRQGWDVLAALRPRVIPGAYRLALLIAVTTFCVGMFLSFAGSGSLGVDNSRTASLPRAAEVDVILIPGWSWDDVTRANDKVVNFGTGSTLDPSAPSLIGSVATGNVKDIVRAVALGTRDDERTETNDVNVIVRPKGLNREGTYAKVRIVMGVTLADQTPELRPIVMQGIDQDGSFASASTKRAGIVDLTDISPTVQMMQNGSVTAGAAQPLQALDDDNALHHAVETEHRAAFYDKYQGRFIATFVAVQLAAYAFAYWRRNAESEPRIWSAWALAIAATPLAALFTQWLYSDKSPHIAAWSASFLVIVGIIVVMSGLASRSTTASLRRVLAATIAFMALDVLSGATMQLGGFFGSSPAKGARYYGFGNVATVLLIVATVLWSVMHVRAGGLIGPRAQRSAWWRAVAVCTVLTFLIGAPGLGSDVGGLFTGVVVFVALFSVLWSGSVSMKRLSLFVVAGSILIVVAAIADARRAAANRTHLGRLFVDMQDNGLSPLLDTIGRKVEANLLAYAFPWSLFLIALAAGILIAMLKGRWAGTLPPNSCERIGAIAALSGSAVAYGVNDSGIVTLVLVAVFLGPFLMVFYRQNRWGIPKLEVIRP